MLLGERHTDYPVRVLLAVSPGQMAVSLNHSVSIRHMGVMT